MLGVAQICHEFKVTSHHSETKTAFRATVRLMDFLKEKIGGLAPEDLKDTTVDVGQFSFEQVPYDSEQKGTYIVASDMRSAFVRRFRENVGNPLPLKFSAFLETVQNENSIKKLGEYWQMIWELALSAPLPYIDEPFLWERITVEPELKTKLLDLQQTLNDYQFNVIIDGLTLRKPISLPYPIITRRDGKEMKGQLFEIQFDSKIYNQPLKLFGYIYLQNGQAIEPSEIRGLLLRIRNVSIGTYDSTFCIGHKIFTRGNKIDKIGK
jgi:hypothetical protein